MSVSSPRAALALAQEPVLGNTEDHAAKYYEMQTLLRREKQLRPLFLWPGMASLSLQQPIVWAEASSQPETCPQPACAAARSVVQSRHSPDVPPDYFGAVNTYSFPVS